MSNRILINATHLLEELRVAVVNNDTVNHVDIEAIAKQQTKAFIYKGKITRIEPSLEACFVDYGEKRHGFLPLKDICPSHYANKSDAARPSIKDVMKEGQELIVQVEKIERGNKGAALTTFITLAGSFLVLMPSNPKAGGVSRRIEGAERTELVEILRQLESPKDMGIIVRTASVGHTYEELQWDLDVLLTLWQAVQSIADEHPAPFLIHQESNAMIRALRDYLRPDLDEIIVDREDIFQEAHKYISLIRPDFADKVKYYDKKQPLFSFYNVEDQVESIFRRELRLPSGGSLSVDQTEALVAIDVNSSRATKGSDIEETAFKTNLEASDEIARQLRLRDIGGLIVIDFIDMMKTQHQREVEDRLRDALFADRAKVQTGRISRFGLLEMSRQRLRSTLSESTKMVCPHCQGAGSIRSVISLSLNILRNIEDHAIRPDTAQIRVHLPTELATYLLNEKRNAVYDIEKKHEVSVRVIPHVHFQIPHFEIERIRTTDRPDNTPSFQQAAALKQDESSPSTINIEEPMRVHQPALQTMDLPGKPKAGERPKKKDTDKKGIIAKLLGFLFGDSSKKEETQGRNNNNNRRNYNNRNQNTGNNNNRRHNNRNNNNNRRNNNNRGNSNYRGRNHRNNEAGSNNSTNNQKPDNS